MGALRTMRRQEPIQASSPNCSQEVPADSFQPCDLRGEDSTTEFALGACWIRRKVMAAYAIVGNQIMREEAAADVRPMEPIRPSLRLSAEES
jgi:hypothetical protein